MTPGVQRLVIALVVGLSLAPATAEPQPAKLFRIGYLSTAGGPYHRAVQEGLRDLGWVEGQNVISEYRELKGTSTALPQLAVDLVGSKVDITRALAIATGLGDFSLEAATDFSLGLAYYGLGDYRLAIQPLGRNSPLLHDQRVYGRFATAGLTSVLSLWILTLCQAELGLFAEAITNAEHAVRIAEAADHRLSAMFADLCLGHAFLAKGDLTRAIPTLERGLATCRTWDFPMWTPWLASRAGAAYVLVGSVADALPLLEQSVEQSTSMGWIADASPAGVRLGEA